MMMRPVGPEVTASMPRSVTGSQNRLALQARRPGARSSALPFVMTSVTTQSSSVAQPTAPAATAAYTAGGSCKLKAPVSTMVEAPWRVRGGTAAAVAPTRMPVRATLKNPAAVGVLLSNGV